MIPTLYEGNRAAIQLASIEESQTFKHVNLCYHFIRSEVKNKRLKLEWIGTANQLGDFVTKALPKPSFINFRQQLMCDVDLFQNHKIDNESEEQ